MTARDAANGARADAETMSPRPINGIAIAAVLALSTYATLAIAPAAPWRVPIVLAMLFWAPSHVLVSTLYPVTRGELTPLERASISIAASLLFVPVIGLATSLLAGFTLLRVAAAYTVTILALCVLAALRTPLRSRVRDAVDAPAPSTRLTAVVSGGAILLGVVLLATTASFGANEPASLAMVTLDTTPSGLARTLEEGASTTIVLELASGAHDASGRLHVRLVDVTAANASESSRSLVEEDLSLAPRESARRVFTIPPLRAGAYSVIARWELDDAREVHAWLDVLPRVGKEAQQG